MKYSSGVNMFWGMGSQLDLCFIHLIYVSSTKNSNVVCVSLLLAV